MLDLLLSFISFILITIKSFISNFVFRPPDPIGYRIIQSLRDQTPTIAFLRNIKQKKYEAIRFSTINYEYFQIPDGNNTFIPILIIRPLNHFDVCIIYSHGNSADIGTSLLECVDLSLNTNCCVISFEYPGYGLCKNRSLTEENVYYNLIKTYLFVREILKFESNKIILYGFSLGTGVSFDLASRSEYPIGGLILHAPFLSILRTIYNMRISKFFDFFCSVDKAKDISAPVLILHGNKDTIVPYMHGKILSKKISEKNLFEFVTIKGANHNNTLKTSRDFVYKRIRRFISHSTNVDFNENYEVSTEEEMKKKLVNTEENNINDIHLKINITEQNDKNTIDK